MRTQRCVAGTQQTMKKCAPSLLTSKIERNHQRTNSAVQDNGKYFSYQWKISSVLKNNMDFNCDMIKIRVGQILATKARIMW